MNKLYIGIIIGICLPILAGFIFLITGGMPVATKGPPLPMERLIAKTAIHAAMKNAEEVPSPITADEINLLSGAKIYMNNCAVCHGQLGSKPTFIAKGLFPKPPQLLEPDEEVTDDPVGESYWKVKNGIRLTGMPGFVDNLTETEMWQVSNLLTHADKLSEPVKQLLAGKAK